MRCRNERAGLFRQNWSLDGSIIILRIFREPSRNFKINWDPGYACSCVPHALLMFSGGTLRGSTTPLPGIDGPGRTVTQMKSQSRLPVSGLESGTRLAGFRTQTAMPILPDWLMLNTQSLAMA